MNRSMLVLLFVAVAVGSFGQSTEIQDQIKKSMPQPVPPSPNVASLGKFIDYPVSYYTGIPDISIPIYEIKSGSLTVPITLSYHASGVKPTDVASWVGMGWSLSTGGQVSRNVHGKPDEESYYNNPIIESPSVCGTYEYLQQAATNVTDTDPDVYSYSFPGKSGQFILLPPANTNGPHPSAYLIPYAPYIVNKINTSKIEVTDDSGVLYRYGTSSTNELSTEGTFATNGGNPSLSATTSWQLMEIIAPTSDDRIDFHYQANGASYTKDVSYVFAVIDQCQSSNGGSCPNQSPNAQPLNIDSYTNQQALREIDFETGKVVFELGGTRTDFIQQQSSSIQKNLSKIYIYSLVNGSYSLEKVITFVYSYFKNANNNDEALKLDEVQFMDKTGTVVVQKYKLNYFTNNFSWDRNSTSFLNARDLWGYYNGATSNEDLITTRTVSRTIGGTTDNYTFGKAYNRAVNATYIKEGVLSRIDFPTGGYVSFDFESNKYDNDGTTTLAGGLRVSTMTSYDGTGAPPITKTYTYGPGGSGIGTPTFNPYQRNYMSTQLIASDCEITEPTSVYQSRTYYSSSAFSLDSFDNSPVIYRRVTEYLGTPTINNGRTEFVYDNDLYEADGDLVVPNATKSYRNSSSWKRGKLTSKTVYSTSNQVLSTTIMHYARYQQGNQKIGYGVAAFIVGNPTCAPGGTCVENGNLRNTQEFFFQSYFQNTGVLVEDLVTETVYEPGSITKFVVTTTSKVNDINKLVALSETFTKSSNPEVRVTNSVYPFNLNTANSSSTGAARGVYLLNNKNISAVPLESYVVIQNDNGSNQRVVSSQVTTYKENPLAVNQAVPDKVYLMESGLPVPILSYTTIAINGSNNGVTMYSGLKSRLRFDTYDADGNLLSYAKENDSPVGFQYGYGNALPVAQVTNASNLEIRTDNFEEHSVVAPVTQDANVHSGLNYWLGDYTINYTKPNSRNYVIDYWYLDGSNKWQYIIKPYTGTSMTLTEGSAIDDVRIYPKDAQISTYTFNPYLGRTSESDTNGRMMFYEYDLFGRLKLIRDTDKNILKTYDYQYAVKLKFN